LYVLFCSEIEIFISEYLHISAVAWHPVHPLLVSGGSEGSILHWDLSTPEENTFSQAISPPRATLSQAHDSNVWSLAYHPFGHILVSASNDHTTRFWSRERPGDATSVFSGGGEKPPEDMGGQDDDDEAMVPGFGQGGGGGAPWWGKEEDSGPSMESTSRGGGGYDGEDSIPGFGGGMGGIPGLGGFSAPAAPPADVKPIYNGYQSSSGPQDMYRSGEKDEFGRDREYHSGGGSGGGGGAYNNDDWGRSGGSGGYNRGGRYGPRRGGRY